MPDTTSAHRSVVGRYTCAPNPGTTNPPLPGLAYAVETADRKVFFLTQGGRWSLQERAWAGIKPTLGDLISVHGTISEQRDLNGELYRTIEVETVTRG